MANKQKRKLNRNLSIAKMSLEGKSQREIAKEMNISQPQVSNILKDEEIKEYIDKGIKYQVSLIPVANERHRELLNSDDQNICLKAVELIYKNVGILPTHAQSTYIQNIYNDNRNISCSPEMMEIIGEHIRSLGTSGQPKMICDDFTQDDDVIDVS